MQQEKCGKVIKDVLIHKDDVSIIFDDETKMKLSNESFSNFYLYKGKTIDINEIEAIKKENELTKIKRYVLNLFSKKMYSEKEIVEKLKIKKISAKTIASIIEYLKEYHFLDDKKYLYYLIEEYNLNNYGKNKILNNLKQKGISQNLISEIVFDDQDELNKAKIVFKNYCLSNSNKSYRSIKETGYSYLINRGFDNEIVSQTMLEIEKYINKEDDKDILLKTLEKYVIIHQVDLENPDQKNKIIKRYLAKGFNYNDINECITEVLWKN